ncbi:CDP-diacylglycerol--glycerol-3-phosphate 3-phosphatidyltransferase [Williamsoniiplasma lucivorax]|uniref:CDP-diacylglycerol--glycerol-3-phosphate 3-phosphatidyltransferase n=1 Tax=Williamsoniiplasma lucivorax TaxID=209274 RepID=A0A2S5RF97_9MOLU|nr:CDP-diacylglycerol--glycerol-3-phosphate 3-phosphatidyltransferase [Williamsoniiplasma lucivorax]PPE06006.1 CDP-diacylglycerol--glycerol-3-phosphate 3-phosphatidyltransferase [Williamsoniiplasma lucivorax]
MNLPNRITIFRLCVVPFVAIFILLGFYLTDSRFLIGNQTYSISIFYLIGGLLFIIGSLSDFLDGYLARKNNQVTDFGKFFDPIADKLLVNTVLILFAWTGMLPVWITLILILRDIFVDFIRMMLSKKQVTLAAGIWGKWKTVFQMFGLSLIFFISYKFFPQFEKYEYGWFNMVVQIPMFLAVIFSVYSGADYFIKAYPTLFKGQKNV